MVYVKIPPGVIVAGPVFLSARFIGTFEQAKAMSGVRKMAPRMVPVVRCFAVGVGNITERRG